MKLTGLLLAAALGGTAFAGGATPPAGPAPAAAPSSPASQVVNQVQQFYAGISQVTAEFQQTVHNAQFGTDKTSTGTVWLQKPGKMRWDYLETKGGTTKVKKNFISNGQNLYVIEHDNKQVIKKSLSNDMMPVAVSFLYGKGDLQAEFNAAMYAGQPAYGAKGDLVLLLTPKQPSAQYKNLILVVDPAQFRVKESVIIDSSDNINHFVFHNPDFQKALKPSIFEFDERSVPSYQIIDGDQPPPRPNAPTGPTAPTAPGTPVPAPAGAPGSPARP